MRYSSRAIHLSVFVNCVFRFVSQEISSAVQSQSAVGKQATKVSSYLRRCEGALILSIIFRFRTLRKRNN